MSKPPAVQEGEKTQTFTVAEGFKIGGYDGKAKTGGMPIELTKAQAEHFLKQKAITVGLPDFDDDNQTEASAGDTTEGDGDAIPGADADADTAPADGDSEPPKRKGRL